MNIADKLTTIAENEQRVYEAGKQSEYDKFWNAIQTAGERTDYEYAFAGYGWTGEIFKPKYDMNVSHSLMMFRYSLITDLTNLSINIDFSKSRTAKQIFEYSAIKHIGDFNVSGVRDSGETTGMFSNCLMLHTIDKFTVKSDGTSLFTNTFENCPALKNITVEGVIGQNISFNLSPLTVASMNSIIAHLKDYSSTGGTHTLTLKKDRETMLTAEEKAVATGKGWSLVWS